MNDHESGDEASASMRPHRVPPKARAEVQTGHDQSEQVHHDHPPHSSSRAPSRRDRVIVNWPTVCIAVVGFGVLSALLVNTALRHGLSEHDRLFDGMILGASIGGLLIALTERVYCGPGRLVLVNLFSLIELPWGSVAAVSAERGLVVSSVGGVSYAANLYSFSGAANLVATRLGGATALERAAATIERFRSESASVDDRAPAAQRSVQRFRIGVIAYLAAGVSYGLAIAGLL